MEVPRQDRIPESLRSRFRVEAELGTGAFGCVLRARDLRLDRVVALKLLTPQSIEDAAFRERFAREARLTARIESPRVARVFDFGGTEPGGWPHIVYQLVEGETLQALVGPRGGNPVPVPIAAKLLDQILEGLEAIHAAGILHRDLKPANVMRDQRGDAVVIDLGLGRSPTDLTVTATGALLGTPAFMAPEQMVGGLPARSWDLYAAALIFYTLAAGGNPLVGSTLPLTHQAKAEGLRAGLVALGVEIPPALDALVLEALDPDPEARPASAGEFRTALRDALGGARTDLGPGPTRAARVPGEASGPAARLDSSAGAPLRSPRGSWTVPILVAAGLVAAGIGALSSRARHRPPGPAPTGPAPAPTEAVSPLPATPAGRLEAIRQEVDGDPAILAAMGIESAQPVAEAVGLFTAAQKAYARLARERGLAALVAGIPVPDRAAIGPAARLLLVERLLGYTTQPGLAPLFPPGEGTGLGELVGRALLVTPEASMTGPYDGDRYGRRARYRSSLSAGGARWVPLRSFEAIIDKAHPELGCYTEIKIRNPAGDVFEFPIGAEGILVTSAYSAEEQERAKTTASEVLLDLEPVPGDLELVVSIHGWVLSAHLWIEVLGADETLGLVWSPPALAPGMSSGGFNFRRGYRLRIPAGMVPPRARKLRLTIMGLQPMGSPKSVVDIEEVYQRVG